MIRVAKGMSCRYNPAAHLGNTGYAMSRAGRADRTVDEANPSLCQPRGRTVSGDLNVAGSAAVPAADGSALDSGESATPPQADGQSPDDEDFDADAAGVRLNEVYERMQEIGSHSAEARAAKILNGLGEAATVPIATGQ